jgi:hypothetical protein
MKYNPIPAQYWQCRFPRQYNNPNDYCGIAFPRFEWPISEQFELHVRHLEKSGVKNKDHLWTKNKTFTSEGSLNNIHIPPDWPLRIRSVATACSHSQRDYISRLHISRDTPSVPHYSLKDFHDYRHIHIEFITVQLSITEWLYNCSGFTADCWAEKKNALLATSDCDAKEARHLIKGSVMVCVFLSRRYWTGLCPSFP